MFFLSRLRRQSNGSLVTGVPTLALPILRDLADILVALLGADRARADEVAELFGDVARRFQVLAGQHDDELLAAIARREPKPVKEMLHAMRDQPQHFVAPRMSPAVVDVLELIDETGRAEGRERGW